MDRASLWLRPLIWSRLANHLSGGHHDLAVRAALPSRRKPDGEMRVIIASRVLGIHALSANPSGWALVGIVNYKRLQGDIAASPIVRDTGSANQFFGSVALAYRF